MQTTLLYYGEIDTPHFRFDVIDTTPAKVKDRLRQAWNTHRKETGAQWTWAEIGDDYVPRLMTLGTVYRDQTEFIKGRFAP